MTTTPTTPGDVPAPAGSVRLYEVLGQTPAFAEWAARALMAAADELDWLSEADARIGA